MTNTQTVKISGATGNYPTLQEVLDLGEKARALGCPIDTKATITLYSGSGWESGSWSLGFTWTEKV